MHQSWRETKVGQGGESAASKKRLVRWEDDELIDSKRMGKLFHQPPTPGSSGKILLADFTEHSKLRMWKSYFEINLSYLSMCHQAVQAELSHLMFLSTSHLNMRFKSSSRNTWVKISTFTPKINYLSQKEECLLQNGSRKVGKKYRETKKL